MTDDPDAPARDDRADYVRGLVAALRPELTEADLAQLPARVNR